MTGSYCGEKRAVGDAGPYGKPLIRQPFGLPPSPEGEGFTSHPPAPPVEHNHDAYVDHQSP